MIQIPCGKSTVTCPVTPDAVLTSRIQSADSAVSGTRLVQEAMANPIGSAPLWQLAQGKKNAVIIISDHTRPVPSKDIIPSMLAQLRQGNPDIDITLLVATGCHRSTTREELVGKLGEEIVAGEKIVIHDAMDSASNVQIGILPSGAPLVIDRVAAEAELLVSEGFIEPHFFAGFSGGRKSVLPGVCDRVTVLGNHCGGFIHDPNARTGILDNNPIHADMVAAARMAKLAFIVNVVIDADHRTAAAFAGDMEQAHLQGVAFLRELCQVDAVPGDIVITSNGGAPLDQNIYQCVKGLTAAEASAKPGAVLIMCAGLADGIGGEGFYRSLTDCASPEALYEQCRTTPQQETIPDQWQSQILARILMKHRVIFVSPAENRQILHDMKLEQADTLEQAIAMARSTVGESAFVTVIPNGVSVMVL